MLTLFSLALNAYRKRIIDSGRVQPLPQEIREKLFEPMTFTDMSMSRAFELNSLVGSIMYAPTPVKSYRIVSSNMRRECYRIDFKYASNYVYKMTVYKVEYFYSAAKDNARVDYINIIDVKWNAKTDHFIVGKRNIVSSGLMNRMLMYGDLRKINPKPSIRLRTL